ncbi:class F sortase [Streptomyces poriferorum]|uniref:Class F sortase n=1 Tax=Streptomyces poriferorum TaxID=2798799 RepID=A0ABY9IUT9_9ACTN|nr:MULTISPECIES: class F sortase [Streptomyces]MBW5251754.1 class F sortase [Streptomyces poriferorum]MBW5256987.1 class F sortase [Streptomyces poriferorum]MDP5311807.1 class F sortase [Streptomyces sp. Alt4]WLQ48192.1 class F sortase [Streptomyces sp. Alt1]WLQ59121.1 class F sortase [Streptomyces sp. Alt2]
MSQKAKGWLLVVAALAGLWLVRNGADTQLTPPAPASADAFAAGPGLLPGSPVADPLRPSAPVRITIPGIRVDAPMMRLGLGPDGSLDVPPAENTDIVGWYEDGPPPGAKGTAIVAGHVDNARGPSVFYDLGSMKKGSTVEVLRQDGRTAVFSVDAIEVYENEDFPDRRVYGASQHASLRLITCGGGFSPATGYEGNVVAYAHLTGVR